MPERFEQIDIDADAILTWDDIRELAKELMGPDHYVTARLYEAVKRYKPRGNPKLRNYDGILEFDEMRQKCRKLGIRSRLGTWAAQPSCCAT
jgi:hypothetical protein